MARKSQMEITGYLPDDFPLPSSDCKWKKDREEKGEYIALPGFIDMAPVADDQLEEPSRWSEYGVSAALLRNNDIQEKTSGAKKKQAMVIPALPVNVNNESEAPADISYYASCGITNMWVNGNDLANPQKLLNAMHNAAFYNITLHCEPNMAGFSPRAQMHQGAHAVRLGIAGHSAIAEHIAMHTLCELGRESGAKIHISGISSARSIDILNRAKNDKIAVSADVHIANLLHTCENIELFDTRFKLWPPLREEVDREALFEAVKKGYIDCISSGHRNLNTYQKNHTFMEAEFGYPQWHSLIVDLLELHKRGMSWQCIANATHLNPAQLLDIHHPTSILIDSDKGSLV